MSRPRQPYKSLVECLRLVGMPEHEAHHLVQATSHSSRQVYIGPPSCGKSSILLAHALSLAKDARRGERCLLLTQSEASNRRFQRMLDSYAPDPSIIEAYTWNGFAAGVARDHGHITGGSYSWHMQAILLHSHIHTIPLKRLKPRSQSSPAPLVGKLLTWMRTLEALHISPDMYQTYIASTHCIDQELECEKADVYRMWWDIKDKHGMYSTHDLVTFAALALANMEVQELMLGRYSHIFVDDSHVLPPIAIRALLPILQNMQFVITADVAQDTSVWGQYTERKGMYVHPLLELHHQLHPSLVYLGSDTLAEEPNTLLRWRQLITPSPNLPLHSSSSLNNVRKIHTQDISDTLSVSFTSYPTQAAEWQGLAKRILQLHEEEGMAKDIVPSPWSSQCVCVPAWGDVERVCASLSAANIPVHRAYQKALPLFTIPIIDAIISLFRLLAEPSNDSALFHVLAGHSNHVSDTQANQAPKDDYLRKWRTDPLILMKLKESCTRTYTPLETLVRDLSANPESQASTSLLTSTVVSSGKPHPYSNLSGLLALVHDLDHLTGVAATQPVRLLLSEILKSIEMQHIMDHQAPRSHTQDASVRDALHRFSNVLEQAEQLAESDRLPFVWPILQLMQTYGQGASFSSVDADSPVQEESDAVHVVPLTLAKEYDHRFKIIHIPLLTEDKFPGHLRESLRIPTELIHSNLPNPKLNSRVDQIEDRKRSLNAHKTFHLRQLYVACTRATEATFMSSVCNSRTTRSTLIDMLQIPIQSHSSTSVADNTLEQRLGMESFPVKTDFSAADPFVQETHLVTPADQLPLAKSLEEQEKLLDQIFPSALSDGTAQEKSSKPEANVRLGLQTESKSDSESEPKLESELKGELKLPSSTVRLTYSSVSTFRRCPHMYYLEYVMGLKPQLSAVVLYGSGMHEACAFAVRSLLEDHVVSPNDLFQVFERYWEKRKSNVVFNSPTHEDELLTKARTGVSSFLAKLTTPDQAFRYPWETSVSINDTRPLRTPIHIEHKFQVHLADIDVLLVGVFDRVDEVTPHPSAQEKSPEMWLVEYKSHMGQKHPQDLINTHLQLKTYSLAYHLLFHPRPLTTAFLESVEDDRIATKQFHLRDRLHASHVLDETAKQIRSGNFQPATSSARCRFCPFRSMCEHSYYGNTHSNTHTNDCNN